MVLQFPAGLNSVQVDGSTYRPDAKGQANIPDKFASRLMNAGFTIPRANGATGSRPTSNLAPGFMFFDTTLNKPIWRNAANTGWIDATGTGV